jgi:hypothetical protein
LFVSWPCFLLVYDFCIQLLYIYMPLFTPHYLLLYFYMIHAVSPYFHCLLLTFTNDCCTLPALTSHIKKTKTTHVACRYHGESQVQKTPRLRLLAPSCTRPTRSTGHPRWPRPKHPQPRRSRHLASHLPHHPNPRIPGKVSWDQSAAPLQKER